ncbi:MAG: tetratricopeptide repeat protein [Gammaproteobacteria bacterium]|nr:tetratricopeptide repeat protein [Gammaproteobacteria bacterium]
MEAYRTEEEQLEALRKWWQENSRSTFAAIALALAASFGWQFWQDHRATQAETASSIYQDMLEAVNLLTAAPAGPEQVATVRHLAGTLKTGYAGSTYAQFAALHLAKMAVAEDDLATAEQELRWVLTANPVQEIQLLTRLRLARVVAAKGDTAAALAILETEDSGTYAASYAEVEGDVYMQLGQQEPARAAYERASSLALSEGSAASRSLQLKLESLNPIPAREVVQVAEEN